MDLLPDSRCSALVQRPAPQHPRVVDEVGRSPQPHLGQLKIEGGAQVKGINNHLVMPLTVVKIPPLLGDPEQCHRVKLRE
jgi:hypothetical protein